MIKPGSASDFSGVDCRGIPPPGYGADALYRPHALWKKPAPDRRRSVWLSVHRMQRSARDTDYTGYLSMRASALWGQIRGTARPPIGVQPR